MVGITITSKELQTMFDILGLNEHQSLVYMYLLSVGSLTIGQISQLTGLNYIQVRGAMEVLVGSDFVDWTPGKINRYFAREPFLQTFMLAYDPITLLSIRDATKKRIIAMEKNLQRQIQPLLDRLTDDDRVMIQDVQKLMNNSMKAHQKQIDNEISALTFTIKEMKNRLDFLFQLSRKIKAFSTQDASGLTTDLLFGETTFLLMLKDITSRTKASLTILMPHPEIQTLIATSKLPPPVRGRTLIIGEFSKCPKNILKKVTTAGVRLKQASVDYWGCIRDKEEILIGPLPQSSEELVGVISTNPTMVQFFAQQIGTYTIRGHDLVIM
ncbi:MAG: helix-turn-helix domain-containing protein [Candidatus Hodarchaeales archaeon]|jgi:sugar-specific transcriptional regulator TrmB